MVDWAETEQERRDLADYLDTLTSEEWDSVVPNSAAPDRALRVREHVAHVIQGATESTTSALLRHHFNSPRVIPPSRMVMVLDVAKTAGFPLGIKKRILLDKLDGDGVAVLTARF